MSQVINIGHNTIKSPKDFDYCPQEWEWCVIEYTMDGYEGSGHAVLKAGDWLNVWSLSHCSCFGPGDQRPEMYHFERFLDGEVIVGLELSSSMMAKVRELLNVE